MIPAAGVEGAISGIVVSHSIIFWILLSCAGILAQGIAGFWWNNGVAEVGAGTASMFMNIQPFVAILASHFVLGDRIMVSQIIGGIFVLLGVFIANMNSSKTSIAIDGKTRVLSR
jgi:drug/metabolite transporter (DMT)-like permease